MVFSLLIFRSMYFDLQHPVQPLYSVIPNEREEIFPKIRERFLPLVEMTRAIDPEPQGTESLFFFPT